MSTFMANKGNIERKWYVIDAAGKPMGKTAVAAADLLRGKRKVTYTPHADCGDNVIIINAEKVQMTGDKMTKREYLRFTGYPGGQRAYTPADLMEKSFKKTIKAGKHPLFIKVVKGMLPKTKLGARQLNNLYVYNGAEHPFESQNPKTIDINKLK